MRIVEKTSENIILEIENEKNLMEVAHSDDLFWDDLYIHIDSNGDIVLNDTHNGRWYWNKNNSLYFDNIYQPNQQILFVRVDSDIENELEQEIFGNV